MLASILPHEPAENILLAMLLVFGGAKIFAEIFERLHLPAIAGELLAGIVLGPSLLNWIQPGNLLKALAELGVVFLLFRVGLEVKSSELRRVGGTALVVAALGVVVPFALGWGIMAWRGESLVESLFVGTALVATSVGITAQVLATKGLLHHSASRMILAAAVIDDVLGLIVLAIVSGMAKGSLDVAEVVWTSVAALTFTGAMALWGSRAMNYAVPYLERRLKAGEGQFSLAMISLFGLGLLATYAGVAAIVGAFLAGMALSESIDRRVHELAQGVSQLLTPFFLVATGLYLDLSSLRNPQTLMLCVVVLVAAIASKVVGCGLGALKLGWRTALKVGVGMTPRGEVGMVVAQIGLAVGVVSAGTYAVIVFMAVATTLIAPSLLQLVFRGDASRAGE